MLKLVARISKFFATLYTFKVPTQLFWSNKIIFRSVFNKILDPSAKSFFPCTYFKMNKLFKCFIILFFLLLLLPFFVRFS